MAPLPPVPLTLIGPVALVTVVAILTPTLAVVLGPPVPISVIVPLVVVLKVPPVREMPCAAPVVAVELAVIWILDPLPDVEKFADEIKPTLPEPDPPVMLFVATMLPFVEKGEELLIRTP